MNRRYQAPTVELIGTFSGAPLCGSTGESYIPEVFPGINDWTKEL